ncbi:MAG: hypothetical protein KC777_11180 [Cyanobacteria bacterium HKST-UBA02]|nr:hypothetical protein [Cyanobacteria bacterium HKST-UBA02]
MNTTDEKTIARINELGTIIANSADEIERLIRQLSQDADAVMAETAARFLELHQAGVKPIMADYHNAHERLVKAAIAASNMREKANRAGTLRSRCGPWAEGGCSRQERSDIEFILSVLPSLPLEPKQD